MTKIYRALTRDEISQLERQQCIAENWDKVRVSGRFTPDNIRQVNFTGTNFLGLMNSDIPFPGGVTKKTGIFNAHLHNCTTGDQVLISNIRSYIANYDIGDHTVIENTDLLVVDGPTAFGNGTSVDVLDETGGRQLMIYDRMSAHTAYLMALYRYHEGFCEILSAMITDYRNGCRSERGQIGRNVWIGNCGEIVNVKIGDGAVIKGTSRLKNGSINSNATDPVLLGYNVVAENFIISSGSEVNDHAVITNCFIGQGCMLGKHYSAINSLFFCNFQGFNGEACSIFAGPFTVSHHKSTLLIAGMFSFCNAGSGSNQSNHMYKLGPIHHGIVERGSKTTSDSYILWPAKIGPFTLVMGRHYKNTDTSNMPFSYLIENKDESWLAPGINLRSVGTIRDAIKWPKRDRRKDPDRLDSVNFNLLSPFTIQRMLNGKEILEQIRRISGQTTDTYTWETTFISRNSLQRGIELYHMAIIKFLGNSLISRIIKSEPQTFGDLLKCLQPGCENGKGDWIDAAGLIAPKQEIEKLVEKVMNREILRLTDLEHYLRTLHENYYELEWCWASQLLEKHLNKKIEDITKDDLLNLIEEWKSCVTGLDKLLYEDARKEFRISAMTGFGVDGDQIIKEQDFVKVRGTFEKNRFVTEIVDHIRKKSELGEKMIGYLNSLT
jgi:carbonic anhydrase/acetyltransferase-like protein (isoleucine patch superfamily)